MDGGIFNNGIQMPVQLQKVNEPVNWQHYRIQAAIAAMQTVDDHVSTVEELAARDPHREEVESDMEFFKKCREELKEGDDK